MALPGFSDLNCGLASGGVVCESCTSSRWQIPKPTPLLRGGESGSAASGVYGPIGTSDYNDGTGGCLGHVRRSSVALKEAVEKKR